MSRKIQAVILSSVFLLILTIILLSIIRLVDVETLTGEVFSSLSSGAVFDFYLMGLRFDAKLAAIALAPLAVAGFLPWVRRNAYEFLYRTYGTFFLCTALLAGLANHQYIQTYGHHFDLMVFGLVNEEPLAVITSIWDGYPVLEMFFCVIFAGIIFHFLLKRVLQFINRRISYIHPFRTGLYLLIFLSLWGFFIRGAVGEFPLRRAAVAVTDLPAVNDHVPSGLLCFSWVLSDYMAEKQLQPANLEELRNSASYFNLPMDDNYQNIIRKQASGPNSRPHVVLAVMESMSVDMLSVDDEKNFNVLGFLREVISTPGVYSFQHFLSEGDGTIDSLSRILVRSGNNLDHSVGRYQSTSFFTSAAKPFKEAGYRTVLVTAGNRGWRNLGSFAQDNGFDEIVDDVVIRSHNKSVQEGIWGVFDGDMFDEAFTLLERSDQPVFMLLLSVTNHPPYQLPNNYRISDMKKPWGKVEEKYSLDDIYRMYETYRYANDMLGDFFLKIMKSPVLKENTIIAATGDHNVRGLNVYQRIDRQVTGHQVPFIIRRIDNKSADLSRYASHKDIMPTLFEAALNNISYYYPGCDLFSDEECPFDFAYNEQVSVGKFGVCLVNNKQRIPYTEEHFTALKKDDANSQACTQASSYHDLTEWYYLYQTVGLGNKSDSGK